MTTAPRPQGGGAVVVPPHAPCAHRNACDICHAVPWDGTCAPVNERVDALPAAVVPHERYVLERLRTGLAAIVSHGFTS